jgi:phosphate transport system permease protein
MQVPRIKSESLITGLIKVFGYSAILFVVMIFYFLISEGFPAITEVSFSEFLKTRWYPIEEYFGILPLLVGSLVVTVGALIIAVLGFLGLLILSQYVRQILALPTGLSALTGALLLAGIAIPSIVSISEDALDTVPKSYRDASLALGATEWQTIWWVTLPAAKSGVLTAIMLGIGRAIGETMVVLMVTGNAPMMPTGLSTLINPTRTMTATIAAEMGEVANGSTHYHVLFFIGIVLFIITLIINVFASTFVFRRKKRSERILS